MIVAKAGMLKIFAMIGVLAADSSYQGAASLDPEQMYCVAKAVYSEARGEPIMGQVAVAWGIKHRVESPDFPDTPCKVIYQTKPAVQFPHIKDVKIDYESPEWDTAVEVSFLSWIGFIDDPIGGARFWYAQDKTAKPTWAKAKFQVVAYNHTFWDK